MLEAQARRQRGKQGREAATSESAEERRARTTWRTGRPRRGTARSALRGRHAPGGDREKGRGRGLISEARPGGRQEPGARARLEGRAGELRAGAEGTSKPGQRACVVVSPSVPARGTWPHGRRIAAQGNARRAKLALGAEERRRARGGEALRGGGLPNCEGADRTPHHSLIDLDAEDNILLRQQRH